MSEQRFHTDILPLKDRIFRVALRVTLDRNEAEDITQETLMRLWQHRDEWDQIQNLEAYSLTIARRLALDYLKKQKTDGRGLQIPSNDENGLQSFPSGNLVRADLHSLVGGDLQSPTPLPDEQLDQQQRVAAVRRLIDQLPETQRTIIQLRDIEGYRYDEIADITGLTETQVRVYLHRARKKIRTQL